MFRRIKSLIINFVVLFLSILISCSILEISIRIFSNKPLVDKGYNHHKLLCEHDSLLGWRKIPDGKKNHVTYEYQTFESFNSKGIRGTEYSYSKSANEYRILMLGDSFTEGYTVEFDDLFSEILKKKLKNNNIKYCEVINAGTGGYSTDQEFLFFLSEGKKYNPDLTILMFYYNDIWYNNQSQYFDRGYKPLFKLKNDTLCLTNVPVPVAKINSEIYQNMNKSSILYRGIKQWFTRNSYLYNLIKIRVKNTILLKKLAMRIGIIENHEIIPDEFKVWEKSHNSTIVTAWRITEQLIIKLKEETNKIGSKLIIFYVPVKASIYSDEWEATKKAYGILDESWDLEKIAVRLESICKKNQIDFINPTVMFKIKAAKLNKEGNRLYFIKDGHWNIEGHRFVGELLADHIKINYLSQKSK